MTAKQITDVSEMRSCLASIQAWGEYLDAVEVPELWEIFNRGEGFARLRVCRQICQNIYEDISCLMQTIERQAPTRSELFASTQGGRIQALLYAREESAEIHVTLLVSAPWNIVPWTVPWKGTKAGTCVMKEVIVKSIQSNKKITLTSVYSSKTFYKKLGFIERFTHFVLTPERAKEKYPDLLCRCTESNS